MTTETGETIQINTHPAEDGGLHMNPAPVEDSGLQAEDGALHITTQAEDGTLHITTQAEDGTLQIQAEDGTTRQVKIQPD